jgi:hypothetical protein
MFRSLLIATLILCPIDALAQGGHLRQPAIFGAWQCNRQCQATHVVATISAIRSNIQCKNERGDLSYGQLISSHAFNCFNTSATLSDDGETIVWSNGSIWRRDHLQEF